MLWKALLRHATASRIVVLGKQYATDVVYLCLTSGVTARKKVVVLHFHLDVFKWYWVLFNTNYGTILYTVDCYKNYVPSTIVE